MVWRYLQQTSQDMMVIFDDLYWPLVDLVLWGMITLWIQGSIANAPHFKQALLSSLVFWMLTYRPAIEIARSILQEIWSRSVMHFFSTPLAFSEWIISLMIIGLIKMLFAVLFCGTVALLLFNVNIFSMGLFLIPFCAMALLSGWSIGLLTSAFIIYGGSGVQTLCWAVTWLFAPFSGAYVPLAALPTWLQFIAKLLPMSYTFENLRLVITTGQFSTRLLATSFMLNIFYLAMSLLFFKYMFERSKNRGLNQLI
jgi:ABC-2 type transport system permease protein